MKTKAMALVAGGLLVLGMGSCPNGQTGNVQGHVYTEGTLDGISGASVWVQGYSGTTVQTDGSGAYALENVPAGSQTLDVKADWHEDGSLAVDVIAGQTITGADIYVAPQVTTGSIHGFVYDSATLLGIQGALVEIVGALSYWRFTDSAGEYILTDVPPGDYTLQATHNDYTTDHNTVPVSVAVGQTTEAGAITLDPTGAGTP